MSNCITWCQVSKSPYSQAYCSLIPTSPLHALNNMKLHIKPIDMCLHSRPRTPSLRIAQESWQHGSSFLKIMWHTFRHPFKIQIIHALPHAHAKSRFETSRQTCVQPHVPCTSSAKWRDNHLYQQRASVRPTRNLYRCDMHTLAIINLHTTFHVTVLNGRTMHPCIETSKWVGVARLHMQPNGAILQKESDTMWGHILYTMSIQEILD